MHSFYHRFFFSFQKSPKPLVLRPCSLKKTIDKIFIFIFLKAREAKTKPHAAKRTPQRNSACFLPLSFTLRVMARAVLRARLHGGWRIIEGVGLRGLAPGPYEQLHGYRLGYVRAEVRGHAAD